MPIFEALLTVDSTDFYEVNSNVAIQRVYSKAERNPKHYVESIKNYS